MRSRWEERWTFIDLGEVQGLFTELSLNSCVTPAQFLNFSVLWSLFCKTKGKAIILRVFPSWGHRAAFCAWEPPRKDASYCLEYQVSLVGTSTSDRWLPDDSLFPCPSLSLLQCTIHHAWHLSISESQIKVFLCMSFLLLLLFISDMIQLIPLNSSFMYHMSVWIPTTEWNVESGNV